MNDLPKTRKEALASGATHYFTGQPCKHGHIAPRKTKGACTECLKLEWKEGNERRADYFRQYNQSAKAKENRRRHYEANKEEYIARAASRPAHVRREYQEAWKERNPEYTLADNKARRRKHRSATPPWLTREEKTAIRKLYEMAILMTKTTGEQYVVDHIYPLRSETVCGLHVPWNLRVITRAENLAKSNALPDDSFALAFSFPLRG